MTEPERLIAVDVGNSRVKLGVFESATQCERDAAAGPLPIAAPLPEPTETFGWDHAQPDATALREWVAEQHAQRAVVASVHKQGGQVIRRLLQAEGIARVDAIGPLEVPIEADVDARDRVGVDRLLGAVAACRLRRGATPAIVVDLGTAITIDLVTADAVFQGGVIMPGIRMASLALHQQTDALPDIRVASLDASPDAVGKSTEAAVAGGLFWGTVGAVREVIARQRDRLTQPPQVFLTGGAAPSVARLLGGPDCTVRYVPHLILAGIAITAHQPPGPAA